MLPWGCNTSSLVVYLYDFTKYDKDLRHERVKRNLLESYDFNTTGKVFLCKNYGKIMANISYIFWVVLFAKAVVQRCSVK